MTIPTIKTNTNTDIRTKTTASSITRANVADLFDALADEILARGIKGVADTTALSALTGTDNKNAIVADNGIWQYASSGTPNGTTIFAASGGGVWVRIFANQDISGKQDTLVSGTNLKTINSMSLLGSGNIDIVTSDEIEEYANLAAFPGTGDTNILYVAIDTEYLYRWSGSAYVQVGGGGGGSQTLDQTLVLGKTSTKGMSIATTSGEQVLIGATTPHTWSTPSGDSYPKVTIEDASGTHSSTSPMINIVSKAEGGIVWEFNPLDIDSDADVPFGFLFGIARDLQYTDIDDYSYTWGINLTAAGGRKDSGQPLFANTIETQYEISGFRWCLEHYTTMISKDGSTIRPLYQIFNRDDLEQSLTAISSDNIRLNGGKHADTQGSMNFQAGIAGVSATRLDIHPGTIYPMTDVSINLNGLEPNSNKVRVKRPIGATGAGTIDDIFRYDVSGSTPRMWFGPSINNAINAISSGRLDLAPEGLSYPTIYSSYWRVVDFGGYTDKHGYEKQSAIQINYGTGTFYDHAEGIEAFSAFRINKIYNGGLQRSWSLGADADKFFINNTTDGVRTFNVANDGSISIGNGTTSAAASSILDLTSTTKGFLPPRGTTTEKNAISSPAEGLEFYDTTLHKKCVYTGSAWETITSS